jgi:hypothetical protein
MSLFILDYGNARQMQELDRVTALVSALARKSRAEGNTQQAEHFDGMYEHFAMLVAARNKGLGCGVALDSFYADLFQSARDEALMQQLGA